MTKSNINILTIIIEQTVAKGRCNRTQERNSGVLTHQIHAGVLPFQSLSPNKPKIQVSHQTSTRRLNSIQKDKGREFRRRSQMMRIVVGIVGCSAHAFLKESPGKETAVDAANTK